MTLAAQILVTDGVYALGVVRKSGAPFRGAKMAALKEMLGFTSQIAGSQWLGFLSRNVDNILIGKVLGPGPLGQYSLSYRFMMLPITNLTMVANRVLLPTYARLQDDMRGFRHSFLRSCKLMSLTATPMMALLVIFASPLIIGAKGETWRGAIVPTQVLALVAIIQVADQPHHAGDHRVRPQQVAAQLDADLHRADRRHVRRDRPLGPQRRLHRLPRPQRDQPAGADLAGRQARRLRLERLRQGGRCPVSASARSSSGSGAGVRLLLEPLGTPALVVAFGGGALAALLAVPVVRVLMPRATLELHLARVAPEQEARHRRSSPTPTPAVAS